MKRIIGLILSVIIIFFTLGAVSVNGANDYTFQNGKRTTEYINGMEHINVTGNLISNGVSTGQEYNYLNLNLSDPDYNLVAVNGFEEFGYGMQGMNAMMARFEKMNPHLEVLGAINGDFYEISSTGEPINTHITNGEVVYRGRGAGTMLTTDYNGKVSFKKSVNEGNEIVVYASDGEIKFREKVTNINTSVSTSKGVNVFFDNYSLELDSSLKPIHVKGIDIKPIIGQKPDGQNKNYYQFAKGFKVNDSNTTVKEKTFSIISEELEKIIEEGDKVIFQARISGIEDIQSATSTFGTHQVVSSGNVVLNADKAKHPRTAIGIKANGDVFTIVVDGRNQLAKKYGVTLEELGYLMKSHGAVEAYNFDGGGSSTLMVGNSTNFNVLNELSDKRIRAVSNGFLIVKGKLADKPLVKSANDTRVQFKEPTNVFVDTANVLHFDLVENATSYLVKIGDVEFETNQNHVPLRFYEQGNHAVTVRTKGDENYKASNPSKNFNFVYYTDEVGAIISYLSGIARKGNRK